MHFSLSVRKVYKSSLTGAIATLLCNYHFSLFLSFLDEFAQENQMWSQCM